MAEEYIQQYVGFNSELTREHYPHRSGQKFVRSAMLTKLLTVRRYAGKLIYEVPLHAGNDLAAAQTHYSESLTRTSESLTRTTGFKTGGAEFLYDLDDSFYSADYLRAWAFEVLLRDHLKTQFGQFWWQSMRAGTFLKELWETGDRYTADEMASQIGIGPISFDALTDEFNDTLK